MTTSKDSQTGDGVEKADSAEPGDTPPERRPSDGEPDGKDGVTRRRMLLGGGASVAAIGGARALYNTVLGYGEFGAGTNLTEQELTPLLEERLRPTYDESIGGVRIRSDGPGLAVGEESVPFSSDRSAAVELDSSFGLDGRLVESFEDISALRDGTYTFEFHTPTAFFERIDGESTRPEAVTAVRSNWDRAVDPSVVERFSGASPSDPHAVVEGLVSGFRAHTNYDVPRYLAGSIEDNVILGAADLRRHFEDDVGFEALLESDGTGIFCWELVFRSIEALQAVSPKRQSPPIAACYVSDSRHKHAYTGVSSAIRVDGELRLPMTFLDYTYSTLYDDFRLRRLLGEGLAAYDERHRATDIYW